METKSTPEVPSETKAVPGLTTPTPQAEAALSPPPPATTGLPVMPQRCASSARSVPVAAEPSKSFGICAADEAGRGEQLVATSRACAVSSHEVPAESDISDAWSPVSFRRT